MTAKILDKVQIPQDRFEMRLSGSGGQGMILASVIFAEAIGKSDERAAAPIRYRPDRG